MPNIINSKFENDGFFAFINGDTAFQVSPCKKNEKYFVNSEVVVIVKPTRSELNAELASRKINILEKKTIQPK